MILFDFSVIERLLGLESKFIRKAVDGFACFFGADLEKLADLQLSQDLSEGLTSLARGVNLVQNFLNEPVREPVGITFLLHNPNKEACAFAFGTHSQIFMFSCDTHI